MSWCTVWKGTSQDCIDHMRKAHDISTLVKAANLARWFPPWTVTREQWTSMTRPAVSGIAVDTLLFHMYQVFDRNCTHAVFRGTHMHRMRTFLEESDAVSLRTRHRRCAREIAARMSRTTLQDSGDRALDVSSRPGMSRRSGSRVWRSTQPATVAVSSVAPGAAHTGRSNQRAVPALMDLAVPMYADPGDLPVRPLRLWLATTDSPASPSPVCLMAPLRAPSPCFYLDALSSDDLAGPGDISAVPICISDDSSTAVNPDQVFSDNDLPPVVCPGDRR